MRKAKMFSWMLAMALSVALTGNVMCVQAAELPETASETEDAFTGEFVIEEMLATDSMEINFSADSNMEIVENISEESFDVSLTGNEIPLYADDGIQTIDAEDIAERESRQYYGTLSDYLSESGDYKLYPLDLTAGDYFQARLTVPNNTSINYALVLYDSELNVIKMSHYIPFLNDGTTLEESVGYIAASDELLYVGIFSLVGGSSTEAYTLDFSITTNYSELADHGEPNENAQEAAALDPGRSGVSVSGMLNSAYDNDWYSFRVIDSPYYDKIRFNLTSNSSSNGCRLEIYQNVTTDYFAMALGGSAATGEAEAELPVGTYYVRVVGTNSANDFNPGDVPSYNLSITPVSRVDGIQITTYSAPKIEEGSYIDEYPVAKYRVWDRANNWVTVIGLAYNLDSVGNKTGAANVKLGGKVVNDSWAEARPDLATTYGSATTREDGFFYMTIDLNRARGLNIYHGDYYDYMWTEIYLLDDPRKKGTGAFYLVYYYT